MIEAISAILLDLDGTLVDSAPELAAAVNGALEPLGRRPLALDEIRGMIGDGIPALAARALAATAGEEESLPPGPFAAEVARLYDLKPPSAPYPGAGETLAALRDAGLALVVCTNKPDDAARRLVARLGWAGLLAAVAGGDSAPRRKPHPDHLLGPLRALGFGPGQALMVGDGVNDARAAEAAGIPFIFAAYGYAGEPPDAGAAAVIERFDQLPGAAAEVAAALGRAFPPPAPAV